MLRKENKKEELGKDEDRIINGAFWLIGYMILLALVIGGLFKYYDKSNELNIVNAFEYAGSFGGAVLGAGTSFIILSITSINQKKESKIQRNIDESNRREDMLNSARPILKVTIHKTANSNLGIDRFYYLEVENSGTKILDEISLQVKNIGTGPARNIEMKIKNKNVTTAGKTIDKFDLGVGEHEIISIYTDYEKVLKEDKQGYKEAELSIICKDIYNSRYYQSIFNLKKEKNDTRVNIIESIEEKIVEIEKEELK